jgi:hypothetical protein
MTRDATRPNKPDELLLWLRGRYPNDTDEELTKRFREHARDDLAIVDRLSDFFLGLNFNRLLRPARAPPAWIAERKGRTAKARELACGQMGGPTCRTAKSR